MPEPPVQWRPDPVRGPARAACKGQRSLISRGRLAAWPRADWHSPFPQTALNLALRTPTLTIITESALL